MEFLEEVKKEKEKKFQIKRKKLILIYQTIH